RAVAGAAAAALLATTLWAGWLLTVHSCRGFGWPDSALSRTDGECIGWTDEEAFTFGMSGLKDVTDKIAVENRDVRSRGAGTNGQAGVPYVRIAVFMPLTSRNLTSAFTEPLILHSLEGVYTAQRRANHGDEIVAKAPLIQLVLVNIGHAQAHWREMADELATPLRGDPPLVAAVGLGVSIALTQRAATALDAHQIPAIGAVLTATSLKAPRLFKVSPSNQQYVEALQQFVAAEPTLRSGTGI